LFAVALLALFFPPLTALAAFSPSLNSRTVSTELSGFFEIGINGTFVLIFPDLSQSNPSTVSTASTDLSRFFVFEFQSGVARSTAYPGYYL
jgi:hypothetical protein